jgi:hypothetical protein
MITNRNSTMMAPAYTITWMTPMKWASIRRNSTPRLNRVRTRDKRLATGLRPPTMPAAPPIANAAKIHQMISVIIPTMDRWDPTAP